MLGYLINQYPAASQTFIRREIAAVEATGRPVRRYAVRGWSGELVDADDRREHALTARILDGGARGLCLALLRTAATRPLRLARALALATSLGRRSRRGVLVHLAYLAEACVLRAWCARDGVDHLHAHFGTNSAAVAMLCRALGGPRYSFTVHGPEEFDDPHGLALADKVAGAAFTVAIAQHGRSQLMRWTRREDWPRLHVVHCGVDPAFLTGAPTRPPQHGRPLLLNIGRLVEQKGQLTLVEAAARLRDAGRDFEVAIVGDGELRPALAARIAALGLQEHVRLLGWRSGAEVRDLLLAARALALPSFAEGLPVVLMEALALHRPVVTTWVAGTPELVQDGRCGWLVPPGDVDALAAALGKALDADPATLAAMGAHGAARVAARHDVAANARQLLALVDGSAGS
jgi:colanic acid/amylovoran biosynthesis glycosyltransferase